MTYSYSYSSNYEKVLGKQLLKSNNIEGEVLSVFWHRNGSCIVVWNCIKKIFIFKKEIIYQKIFTAYEVNKACNILLIERRNKYGYY